MKEEENQETKQYQYVEAGECRAVVEKLQKLGFDVGLARQDDAEARWQAIEESREHLRRYEPEQASSCSSLAEAQVWIIRAHADWLMRTRFAIGIWTQATDQYLDGIGLRPRGGDGWSVPAFAIGYAVKHASM